MGYQDCHTCTYKCKKKHGKCRDKIEFDVKCPAPVLPLPNSSIVDYRKYTVGGGVGVRQNEYTVSIPSGTQFITVRCGGAGGGGGGIFSEVFEYTGGLINIVQPIQGGGGGAKGFLIESTRPYCEGMGFPTTINVTVGAAANVATDPLTGIGNDGDPSIVSFSPALLPGWDDIKASGGKGGGVGKSTGDGEGFAGDGGNGGLAGGGGGELCLLIGVPPTIIPPGVGGNSKQGQDGDDGDLNKGGDGAENIDSGSLGTSIPLTFEAGGGGGGGGNGGGVGGAVGDNGGDFNVQDSCAGGGGCGLFIPELSQVGTTISCSGGLGAHGFAELWFYISKPPS